MNIKNENDFDFQKRIQELEVKERKEELEKKRLDNRLKKLEIERMERELNNWNNNYTEGFDTEY